MHRDFSFHSQLTAVEYIFTSYKTEKSTYLKYLQDMDQFKEYAEYIGHFLLEFFY